MNRTSLNRPIAEPLFPDRPAYSRRTVVGIPVAGLLTGFGLSIACVMLAGAVVFLLQSENIAEGLPYASAIWLVGFLGIAAVRRYRLRRVVDRLQPCREMLKQRRLIRCVTFPTTTMPDE